MATATNGSTPTQARTRPDVNGSRPMPTPPRVAPPRGRRRPGLLALGVALVAVGALTAAWLVSTAGQRSPVVVVLRDVPYGAVLTSGDVGSADVSVDANVATIPASQLDSVVGSVPDDSDVAATLPTTESSCDAGIVATFASADTSAEPTSPDVSTAP